MKLTIFVTDDDIEKGIRCNAGWCPIARAARRAFDAAQVPYNQGLSVSQAIYPLGYGPLDKYPRFSLPSYAKSFVYWFDQGHDVMPFSFEIEVN